MKTILLILSLFVTASAMAQTNSMPALPPPLTNNPVSKLPGGIGQLGSDVVAFLTDAQPYFTNSIRYEIGALYADKHVGGLLDVQFPINSTGQISIGFAGAYLHNSFYDASIGANLGTTWSVPIIGNVYSFLESGPGYNFNKKQAIVQSFAGVLKKWKIGSFDLTISGGAGEVSDISGPAYFAGISLNKAI